MKTDKSLNINLTALDDLFETTESREDNQRERLYEIELSKIHDFPNHPYHVKDDEAMNELVSSIQQSGLISPIMVRKTGEDSYELIAGHRRKRAFELAGIKKIPCRVFEMSHDEAVIAMVDSNLQRDEILPSEKAFAYRMRLEAMNHQGKRTDLTSAPVGHKLQNPKSRDTLAEIVGESREQIRRYIRLTELISDLLQMVDERKIALRPAVELSYLTPDEQRNLLETIRSEDCTPSLAQAQQMRKLSELGQLSMDAVFETMTKQKANQVEKIAVPISSLPVNKIRFFTKAEPTPKVMQDFLLKAVDHYVRYLNRQREWGER